MEKNTEFYSPKFINSLGFEVEEVSYTPEFWQKQIKEEDLKPAIDNAMIHIETRGETPYYQIVHYNKKNGGEVTLFCSGRGVFKNGKMLFFIGSHKIL